MTHKFGRLVLVIGALGLAMAAATPALADGHSGGHDGGGGHGGGGGHSAGGAHFSAAPHYAAPRYAAPHYAAHGYAGGAHFAPRYPAARSAAGAHYGSATRYPVQHYPGADHGNWNRWNGHQWQHYRRDDDDYPGWYGAYWGGGYWGNGFWPAVNYGVDFAWFLPVLPGVYATYWYGGMPYYYANDVYYTWDPNYDGYVATDPPPVADSGGSANSQDQSPAAGEIYMYPKQGQSAELQSEDRRACQQWAANQTSGEASSQAYGDYRRAMTACAEGRGYSVE